MKHSDTISDYPGTLTELAEEIGNLKYDALAEFLHLLSVKIKRDSVADAGRGRAKLAVSLQRASEHLHDAKTEIDESWRISKPYMPDVEEIKR